MWRILVGVLVALTAAPAAGNPTHKQLQQLAPPSRAALFAQLLSSSGQACPVVSRTFYQGSDRSGAAFWNVQCQGGKAWTVMIRNDRSGTARYVECADGEEPDAAPCFRRF